MSNNNKTLDQKKEVYKKAAQGIFNFLQENRNKTFLAHNKSTFKKVYDEQCKKAMITAYKDKVVDYLDNKKLLLFKGNKCELKEGFLEVEIFEIIEKLNTEKLGLPRKSTGKNAKCKKIRFTNKAQENNNLVPILEAFKKMPIIDKIKSMTVDDVGELVKWMRQLGLEVTVKRIIIEEY